jgi:hypothetical protein
VECEGRHTATGRGIALLIISIPLSIVNIIDGVIRLMQGDVSERVRAYAGIAGNNNGLMMTGRGAVRAFKKQAYCCRRRGDIEDTNMPYYYLVE